MTGTPLQSPEPEADDQVAGDVFARSGQWRAAVTSWTAELDGQNSALAEGRLRWFLETTVDEVDLPQSRWRSALPDPFFTGVAAAIIGTAAVLIAETIQSPWNHALAVAAWLLFVLAAACGLIYAKRHGSKRQVSLTTELLQLAQQQATLIDAGSATIDDGSR